MILVGQALEVMMSDMRLNSFSGGKQVFLLFLASGLLAFVVYINWIAPPSALRFIGSTQLDKLAHLAGGIFLAIIAEWRFPRLGLLKFLAAVIAITIGWEMAEFFFDPETQFFASVHPDLWRLDAAGDIIAAFLGGYGYWVLGRGR